MAKKLAWVLELLDKMSGPARGAARAVDNLEDQMEEAARAANKLDRGLDDTSRGMNRAERAANKASSKFDKLSGAAVALGTFAGTAALDAASFMADMAFEAGKAAFELRKFDESTKFAFGALLGVEKGTEAYEKAIATADKLGASQREVLASYNALLPAMDGNVERVDNIINSMADLAALNPSANLEGIARAISQIQSTGKLQGDELLQLNEAGLATTLVYDELSKALGKTKDEVKALQSEGKIDSKTAIDAILAAINKQAGGGEAGALATEKSLSTLEGTIGRLQNRAEDFVRTMQLDGGPLIGAIGRFSEFLNVDTAKGRRFQEMTEKVANATARISAAGLDEFSEALDESSKRIKVLFDDVSDDELDALGQLFGVLAGQVLKVAEAVAVVIAALAWLSAGYEEHVAPFIDKVGSAISNADWGQMAADAGQAIVDGLAGALESGAGRIVAAMTNPVAAGVSEVKGMLDINSPSGVFMGIGENIVAGLEGGLGSGNPQQTITGLIDPTAAGQAAAATVTNVNNTQNKSGPSIVVNISVTGGGDPNIAGKIRAEVENALAAVA